MPRESVARKSLVQALPSSDKAILLGIKASFAFSWAFMNAVCYYLTSRFFTMMSGNTLILANETLQWQTEEMAFTAVLICLFVLGGAAYEGVSLVLMDDDQTVKRFTVPSCIVLGALADVIQYVLGSCSTGIAGQCSGNELYFLSPMAVVAGILTSYCMAHPDGIITNLITNHMKVPAKSILQRVIQSNKKVWEKARVSTIIIASFFTGSLVGGLASKGALERYSKGLFTPLFTSSSLVVAALTLYHFILCEKFCHNHQLESEMIEQVRATLMASGVSARSIKNLNELQGMMMAIESKEMESGNNEEDAKEEEQEERTNQTILSKPEQTNEGISSRAETGPVTSLHTFHTYLGT